MLTQGQLLVGWFSHPVWQAAVHNARGCEAKYRNLVAEEPAPGLEHDVSAGELVFISRAKPGEERNPARCCGRGRHGNKCDRSCGFAGEIGQEECARSARQWCTVQCAHKGSARGAQKRLVDLYLFAAIEVRLIVLRIRSSRTGNQFAETPSGLRQSFE